MGAPLKATPSAIEMGLHGFRMSKITYIDALEDIVKPIQWVDRFTGDPGRAFPVQAAEVFLRATSGMNKAVESPERMLRLMRFLEQVVMDGETEVTELLHLLGKAEAGFINGSVDVFKAAPAARNIIREFQQVGPVPDTAAAEVETTAHSWDGKLSEMLG